MTLLLAGGLRNRRSSCAPSGLEDSRFGGVGTNPADGLDGSEREHVGQDARRPRPTILGSEPRRFEGFEPNRELKHFRAATKLRQGILLGSGDTVRSAGQMGRSVTAAFLAGARFRSSPRARDGDRRCATTDSAASNAVEFPQRMLPFNPPWTANTQSTKVCATRRSVGRCRPLHT